MQDLYNQINYGAEVVHGRLGLQCVYALKLPLDDATCGDKITVVMKKHLIKNSIDIY